MGSECISSTRTRTRARTRTRTRTRRGRPAGPPSDQGPVSEALLFLMPSCNAVVAVAVAGAVAGASIPVWCLCR